MCACEYVCIFVYVHVLVFMCVHVCVYMYVCTCMCVHVCVYMYVCMLCMCVCMYVCVCVYMCVCLSVCQSVSQHLYLHLSTGECIELLLKVFFLLLGGKCDLKSQRFIDTPCFAALKSTFYM